MYLQVSFVFELKYREWACKSTKPKKSDYDGILNFDAKAAQRTNNKLVKI